MSLSLPYSSSLYSHRVDTDNEKSFTFVRFQYLDNLFLDTTNSNCIKSLDVIII